MEFEANKWETIPLPDSDVDLPALNGSGDLPAFKGNGNPTNENKTDIVLKTKMPNPTSTYPIFLMPTPNILTPRLNATEPFLSVLLYANGLTQKTILGELFCTYIIILYIMVL